MAKNFEIIFNIDNVIVNDNGTPLNHDNIIAILNNHNCKWLLAPHPIDEKSSFNHYHLGIHTDSDNTYDTIAKWFGLKSNNVQAIKSRFDSTYALYIAHYNQDGKSPIDTKLIENNFNFDYNRLITNVQNKASDEKILNQLANGEITEYYLYSNQSEDWCRKHLKQINDALIVRSKKFMVSNKERNMEVVYISGEARCGKSYLAKKLAMQSALSLYVSSNGEHPFDDYMGQDAVLLDDIRGSNFRFSELLKILDNHMSSKVSARYHNVDLNCKVMYLTSVMPIEEFYKDLLESKREASEQLKGRIGMYCYVTKDNVTISVYDNITNTYKPISKIPNPILSDETIQLMDTDKRKNLAIEMFRGIADLTTFMADNLEAESSSFVNCPDNSDCPFTSNP